MENLFNSNKLFGIGMMLSALGGERSMNNGLNMLNMFNTFDAQDRAQRKEDSQDAAVRALLGGGQSQTMIQPDKVTFSPDGQMTNTPQAPVTQNLLSSANKDQLLATALGPKEYLLSQMAAAQDSKKLTPLAEGAVLTDSKGNIVSRNPKPADDLKVGATRDIGRGDQIETQEYQGGGQWKTLGQRPAFAPKDPRVTWKRLSSDEAAQEQLPPGGQYERSSDGQTRAFVPPNKDMGPGKMKLAGIESAAKPLLSALEDFQTVVDKSRVWDKADAATGGVTAGGKDLNAAWTNAALMAKGEALYNLGVLSGPDLDIIRNTLTDPSTMNGLRTGKAGYKAGIDRIRKLVNDRVAAARNSYAAEGGTAPVVNVNEGISIREGATATGPGGQRIIFKGGQWEQM